jgi:hypothetical protein
MLLAAIASPLHLARSNGRLQPHSCLPACLPAEQLENGLEVAQLQVAASKQNDVVK